MDEKEQLKALKAFAHDVLNGIWDGGIDGEDVEAFAQKHGLISLREMTRPCGEDCLCADAYTDNAFKHGVVRCNVVADWMLDEGGEVEN